MLLTTGGSGKTTSVEYLGGNGRTSRQAKGPWYLMFLYAFTPLAMGVGSIGAITADNFPTELGFGALVATAAWLMFKQLLNRQTQLEQANIEVEKRCREEIHTAVDVAVTEERARSAEVELRLSTEIARLKSGLQSLARTVKDPDALAAVLRLITGEDVSEHPQP